MTDYTPTTEQVFELAFYGAIVAKEDNDQRLDEVEFKAMLDRWLVEHDRQVAEKAWDEGYGPDEECGMPKENPYRKDQA